MADNIRAKLTLEAARAKAIAAGQEALKEAQSGHAVSGWSAPMTVSRLQPLNLPPQGIQAIFRADAAKLPALAGTETRDGYALYRVTSVTKVKASSASEHTLKGQLAGIIAKGEMDAYLAYLKAKLGVKVNEEALSQKAE